MVVHTVQVHREQVVGHRTGQERVHRMVQVLVRKTEQGHTRVRGRRTVVAAMGKLEQGHRTVLVRMRGQACTTELGHMMVPVHKTELGLERMMVPERRTGLGQVRMMVREHRMVPVRRTERDCKLGPRMVLVRLVQRKVRRLQAESRCDGHP